MPGTNAVTAGRCWAVYADSLHLHPKADGSPEGRKIRYRLHKRGGGPDSVSSAGWQVQPWPGVNSRFST